VFDWTIVDRIDKNPPMPVEKAQNQNQGGSLDVNVDGVSAENVPAGPSKFKPKGEVNKKPANHTNSSE
jgi:hypothetical protein